MLSCAALLWNSKVAGLKPDRSYSERSAVSTNRSASSSVTKVGIFRFIVGQLLAVHVAGADRPDQLQAVTLADGEHEEDGAALLRSADPLKSPLGLRVSQIGLD